MGAKPLPAPVAIATARYRVKPGPLSSALLIVGSRFDPRSAADVDSPEALLRVREWKRAQKAAKAKAKAKASAAGG
jgi:hypothetical protein